MTVFDRIVRRFNRKKKQSPVDIGLLLSYHETMLELMKYHALSDQHYVLRYKLELLNSSLHGHHYDYSNLTIQPEEEVARLAKLAKRYKKAVQKREFPLTFFHWHKTEHRVVDGFPEMQRFMKWYNRRLNAKRKAAGKSKDRKCSRKSRRVRTRSHRVRSSS